MKKVLIITYYWPPSGGAGVQRWLKFVKYLPSTGWQPVVLTIRPDYAAYPVLDQSLENEISQELSVIKTKAINFFPLYSKDPSKIPSGGFANNPGKGIKDKISRFIRGNFFIPDPRRGWNLFAVNEAARLIKKDNIGHFITTSPPHSTQLIGLRLKKKFPGITWIADLRDTWTDIYYYDLFYPTFISRAIDLKYEKLVIRNADRIITVGKNLSATFTSKVEGTDKKAYTLPNGFDEEDFENISTSLPERFTITYSGTISDVYPLNALISALTEIDLSGKDFLLRFVGSVPADIRKKITDRISITKTEFIPYTQHKKAVQLLAESTMLLLIIPDHKKNDAITPGKVFEYIASARTILYIGPEEGDAAYHLKKYGHAGIFNGKNSEEIREFIIRSMDENISVPGPVHTEYSRRELTKKLCEILNS